MRIEFLTQDDPLYILPLFEEFFRSQGGQFEVVRVSSCPTMGSRSRSKLVRELLQLYGPFGLARLLTRVAASKLMGKRRVPAGAPHYYSLRQLCWAYGAEYRDIGNPNAPEFVAEVKERNCDLIVSVACPYILKKDLLSIPRLGCINIHHAPLPRYKGMMPTFWQMYHGEKSVGLTIHKISERIDEGAALLQERLTIEPGETLDHLIRRSKRHAAHCLVKVLNNIQTGSVEPKPLDQATSSYFTFPTFDEIREFHRRGLRAI